MGYQYKVEALDCNVDFLHMAGAAARQKSHTALLYSPQFKGNNYSGEEGCWRVLGFDPVLIFKSKGPFCEFTYENVTTRVFGNPWTIFESRFSQFELLEDEGANIPLGAAIGYFGYDMKNSAEPGLPQTARDELESYDCFVGFYTTLFIQEKLNNNRFQTKIVVSGHDAHGNCHQTNVDENLEKAHGFIHSLSGHSPHSDGTDRISLHSKTDALDYPNANLSSKIRSSLSENEFVNCVRRAKEWIRHGHIYQVNLSQRLSVDVSDKDFKAWDFFCKLLSHSGAEFGGYINADSIQIMSCSPELFLNMNHSRVVTSPIKGTRPRSSDPEEDKSNLKELLSSKKERAELTMITDLLRNDIGKVSEYGAVSVLHFLKHKALPNVHHMYSTIQGDLRKNMTHLGALRSCFPGGSITGAPKVRSMEIIDELEPVTRGPYTGTLGYLGFNQISQFNILIRSAHLNSETLFYSVGAGIVADSDPEMEYLETWHKAKDFIKVLEELNILRT